MNITQRKLAYSPFIEVSGGRAPRHLWATALCRMLYRVLLWAVIAFVAMEAAHGVLTDSNFIDRSNGVWNGEPVSAPRRLAPVAK